MRAVQIMEQMKNEWVMNVKAKEFRTKRNLLRDHKKWKKNENRRSKQIDVRTREEKNLKN